MQKKRYFIFDFDSTFVTKETLEELALITLESNPQRDIILEKIMKITEQGMNGKIPFEESLARRLALFQPTQESIVSLSNMLTNWITPSVLRNKSFFRENADRIYIITGGFKEYITPLAQDFGIAESHVLANSFIFDKKGNFKGIDNKNPLSRKGGKAVAVDSLKLDGKIYIIGDGFTDYEIKEKGAAHKFYAFTENIRREAVISKADAVIKNIDELLYKLKLPRALSFPKSKIKVLLLENIHPKATELFSAEGYEVETLKKALSEKELIEAVEGVSILGIRSKTQITDRVLSAAKNLHTVGAYCIGTNQIDLSSAAQKGVIVFNAPYSNTRSVVELILGEIIMLYRKIFDKSSQLHGGKWDKSAGGCHEIRGKKLGIIGYGNIGSQLSVVAENLGMGVYFYDTSDKLSLGNAHKVETLQELLQIVDVITVHVDGKKNNTNLIGEQEFAQMKQGVLFLNASRGFVVDLDSLVKNLKSGKVAGAAIDVFPSEPKGNDEKFKHALQKLPNVILTPHVGGSTEEAQLNIGLYVTQKLINFINSGNTLMSVNFPQLQLPEVRKVHRLIHIHRNVSGVMGQINSILARININIEGQYLQTNNEVGYVITDVNTTYSQEVLKELKKIPATIRLRVLY